jgi:hypothetical protein
LEYFISLKYSYNPLILEQCHSLYGFVFSTLVETGILGVLTTNNNAKVWGIEPTALFSNLDVNLLRCDHASAAVGDRCHDQISTILAQTHI